MAASSVPALRALSADARHPVLPLPPQPALDRTRVAIGERLFADPRLSLHGRISCQSCHDVATSGASPWRLDKGDDGSPMQLNTPTVFNSTLNFRFTWTGRILSAPDMIAASLRNPHVMGGDGPGIERLRRDSVFAAQVRAAYHRELDERATIDALTLYLRSLTTPNARFDRWLAGDAKALTPQEQRGWARFQSVGCVSCHQGVNVGGNLFQRHGIFHPLASPDPAILRVPSLRNVMTTAPYFHDGSAPDLSSAVLSMARAQLDITLSPRDVADITAFLKTLTGTYEGRPVQAPRR
ncbi:cytochrome-c peroxidase [Sphingomonas sp. PR090111-T3T-6A]|uniref:cytochrome-c peroxidase n=1 Tax=Sphingomonas sp. PR090111-T3T-6A TaxID=685778 RepID=UPI000371CBAC|nr:cytochrome c peroxidase [Sphingomonas sp. PR090111-T3T-6A]